MQQKDSESRESLLDRWRQFNDDTPFYAWLANVAILVAITAFFFGTGSKTENFGFLQMALSSILMFPTILLLQRCSDKEVQANPVSPQQLKAMGIFSLIAVSTSISALLLAILSKRFGLILPTEIHLRFIMVFAFSGLLGLLMGFAGRKSGVGMFAYRLAVTWLLGLIAIVILLLMLSALRGSS